MVFFLGLIGFFFVVMAIAFLIDESKLKGGIKNIPPKEFLVRLIKAYLLVLVLAAIGLVVRVIALAAMGEI